MIIPLYTITAWLTCITAISVGILVYIKNPKRKVNRKWFFLSLSVSMWGLFLGFMFNANDAQTSLVHTRMLLFASIWIPITFYHFIIVLLDLEKNKRQKNILFAGYTTTILLWLANFTPLLAKSTRYKVLAGCFYPDAGPLMIVYILFYILLAWYSCILMYKTIKVATGKKKNQIQYLLLGTSVGFVTGATTFPLWYQIQIPPLGSHLVWFYALVFYVAIVRYNLLDIRIVITRAGLFTVVYTLVLGIPFYIGYQTKSWLAVAGSMFFLATLGPLIYRRLRSKADDLILAQQRQYQKTLKHIHLHMGRYALTKNRV